jgi:cation transport ATPase
MFYLEQAILEWRRQMLAAGIKTPVPLEELDSHLREEIEQQMKSGLSEQEIFDSAVQKIGQAHMIQNEFKKVEKAKEARNWKLTQILFAVVTSLFSLFLCGMVIFKMGCFSETTSGQKTSSLAAIAAFALLAWGGRLSYGILPIIRARQIRDAICISGGVLLMLWWMILVHIILPRHDFTTGQLLVTILWEMITPCGIFLGSFWGIETAARKKL